MHRTNPGVTHQMKLNTGGRLGCRSAACTDMVALLAVAGCASSTEAPVAAQALPTKTSHHISGDKSMTLHIE